MASTIERTLEGSRMLAEANPWLWVVWVVLGAAIVTMVALLFQIEGQTRETHRAVREIVRRLNADEANKPS
jgi:hypothetical protein